MKGAIDAWNGLVSKTEVDQGIYLIEGCGTREEVISLAYGLEEGAYRFYRDLSEQSSDGEIQNLFEKLSQGGLKPEANFDLGAGEPTDFTILTNRKRIQCKGRVIVIRESRNKVQDRLRFTPTSDWECGRLSDYLHALSRRLYKRGVTGDRALLLWGTTRHGMMKRIKWVRSIFEEIQEAADGKFMAGITGGYGENGNQPAFGLNGADTHTLESIGERFGLTPETVRQIEAKAIEKLRKMSKKKELDLDDNNLNHKWR
jgi:hypothetical protein